MARADGISTMTKEELDELRLIVRTRRRQEEEELRDWVPPVYFTQREINAEREHRRRLIKAYEAHEEKLVAKILGLGLRRRLK